MKQSILIIAFVFIIGTGSVFYGIKNGLFLNQAGNSMSNVQSEYNPAHYNPVELKELLEKNKEKYIVIDARTKLEYNKGHVPGAVHADYYDTDALVKAAGGRIPITYDAFSSMRGIYAAYILYQSGYKNIGILLGGLSAWAEDIKDLDSADPGNASVFMHPKNIFPERKRERYPKDAGSIEINITVKRFSFNPNLIVVKQGQKVVLHIKSIDVIHGFSLPEYQIEQELLPNQPMDIIFTADRKGNFPFVTNVISGSRYSSMVGNLIVE